VLVWVALNDAKPLTGIEHTHPGQNHSRAIIHSPRALLVESASPCSDDLRDPIKASKGVPNRFQVPLDCLVWCAPWHGSAGERQGR